MSMELALWKSGVSERRSRNLRQQGKRLPTTSERRENAGRSLHEHTGLETSLQLDLAGTKQREHLEA